MKHRPWLAAAAAGTLLLVPATAAQAKHKEVYVGTPTKGALPGVQGPAFDNDFYPNRITIAAGDTLTFKWAGFGNVLYVPKGAKGQGMVVPGEPVSGAKDAAGADFWFNGRPGAAFNPKVLAPTGGKVIDGSKLVGSGVPMGKPTPWKVRFPKAGTYTLTSLHDGVTLKVTVKRKGAAVPSAKADAKRVKAQTKAAAKLAKSLLAAKGPSGETILMGNDREGVATLGFFPAEKTVKAGTTVTFAMSKRSTEQHNAAFAPADYVKGLVESFFGPTGFDPLTAFPSQAPGTALAVDGAAHGNGYVNTGVLDTDKRTSLPSAQQVTFTTPGTYTYYCVVHGGEMTGTVTVTG
jgi:plastocyanin